MDSEFYYIINKINNAEIIDTPFPHINILNFLSEEHLRIITTEKQMHFETDTQDELYSKLINNGWVIQNFPGCTNNWETYKNLQSIENEVITNEPVESMGMTFRLKNIYNTTVNNLIRFMNSSLFHNTLRSKFNIENDTTIITAIQKYLTGYEISPHPDIRQKSLTYLLNINNNSEIEKLDCHTHLLVFKDEYKFISEYWKNNKSINRCWVPWDWCTTVKTTRENNSLLIFKPDDAPPTLHAIKLNYNHLKYQRTQIYGNLMYENPPVYKKSNYKDFI